MTEDEAPNGDESIVYVHENPSADVPGWMTATFGAVFWPDGDDGEPEEGPTATSLDEALAWARARSPYVSLFLDHRNYSVGSQSLDDRVVYADDDEAELEDEDDDGWEPPPPWPEAGIVVEPRFYYEPAGQPRATSWWARCRFAPATTETATDLVRAIEADDRVLEVRLEGKTPPVIDVRLPASDDEMIPITGHRVIMRARNVLASEQQPEPRTGGPRGTTWRPVTDETRDDITILGPG